MIIDLKIETYQDRYSGDLLKLAENFHKESIGEYDAMFDPEAVIKTIEANKATNAENCFLLVINGVCQGVLFGVSFNSMTSGEPIFQEIIWYVNEPFRRYGIKLLKEAEKRLKLRNIKIIIMAVMENSKTEKLKAFYTRLGFRPMETHFVRNL